MTRIALVVAVLSGVASWSPTNREARRPGAARRSRKCSRDRDLRAIAYVSVDVPLVHGLAAHVAVDASYEQVIAAGTGHGDLAVTFGLAYADVWRER